jgi:hypothetical protein
LHEEEDPELIAWLGPLSGHERGRIIRRLLRRSIGLPEDGDSLVERKHAVERKGASASIATRNSGGPHPSLDDIPDFDPRNFKFGDPSPTR